MRLIDADDLKEKSIIISDGPIYKEVIPISAIDNAPTVEPYQDKERVTIEMSEEEIEKFRQMLIDIFKDILKEAKNDNL